MTNGVSLASMIVDSSSVVAVLEDEPERGALLQAISDADSDNRLISAPTLVEAALVMESRRGLTGRVKLDELISDASIRVEAFTPEHAELAREAWRRYGKGRHPARLNLGDCCVYALARATGLPILCKGNDFAQTDALLVKWQ